MSCSQYYPQSNGTLRVPTSLTSRKPRLILRPSLLRSLRDGEARTEQHCRGCVQLSTLSDLVCPALEVTLLSLRCPRWALVPAHSPLRAPRPHSGQALPQHHPVPPLHPLLAGREIPASTPEGLPLKTRHTVGAYYTLGVWQEFELDTVFNLHHLILQTQTEGTTEHKAETIPINTAGFYFRLAS